MVPILLVAAPDDAADLAAAIESHGGGYDVETATSQETALDALESAAFGAVVCEQSLPDGTGIGLLRRLRDLDATPFVLLAESLTDALVTEIVALDVDGYVPTAGLDRDDVARLTAHRLDDRLSVVGSHELFDSVADGLLVHDPETGAIEDVNGRFCEMMDYDRAELLGETPAALTAPESGYTTAQALELIRKARDEGPQIFEWRNRRKDGSEFPVEVHLRFVHRRGAPYVLASVRDISERKSYQRELEWQRDQFEALNRLLRHDVRNDLSIVVGWGEELRTAIPTDQHAALDRMLGAARHAIELTQTVRDLVEVMHRGPSLGTEPTAVAPLLSEELDHARQSFPHATFAVDGDVPECTVEANELLRSVFRNLLSNAVQHNASETPRVTVSCDVTDESLRVDVADNGPGIPDEKKETLFDPDDSLTEEDSHVGLFLVNLLVREFGGSVRVDDNAPAGAVFSVELPLR